MTTQAWTSLSALMAEHAPALDSDGHFPHHNLAQLHQRGLLSLATPQQYGGGGATLATLQQAIRAIAVGEPATALIVCMQYLHHLRLTENTQWPEALREAVCRSAVNDGALINSLRVEPELGSPARGGLPQTVATRTEKGWLLNGHKLYTTGIDGLQWLAVWARSDDEHPQVGTWLVPKASAGIRVIKSWDHLGMRATGSHEVIFSNVLIPLENAVDTWPASSPPAPDAEQNRLFANRHTALLAAIYDGVAQAARSWLVTWLTQRTPASLGQPLSSLPRVQEKVGQIDGVLLINECLLARAAALGFTTTEANLAKVTVTENAIQAVNLALELTGNHGLSRHHPLERHYRNVLCGRVHTPQNDSAWQAAGRFAFMQ